jgi:hypothetical protein
MRSSSGDAIAIAACEAMGIPTGQISACSIEIVAGEAPRLAIGIILTDSDLARIVKNLRESGASTVMSVQGTPDEIKSIAESLSESIKNPLAGVGSSGVTT